MSNNCKRGQRNWGFLKIMVEIIQTLSFIKQKAFDIHILFVYLVQLPITDVQSNGSSFKLSFLLYMMNTTDVFCTKFTANWQDCWLEHSLATVPPRKDTWWSHGSILLSVHLHFSLSLPVLMKSLLQRNRTMLQGLQSTREYLCPEWGREMGNLMWTGMLLGVSPLTRHTLKDHVLGVTDNSRTTDQKVWRWQDVEIISKNSPLPVWEGDGRK